MTTAATWRRQGWASEAEYQQVLSVREVFGLSAPTDEEAAELRAEAARREALTPEQRWHEDARHHENFKRRRNRAKRSGRWKWEARQ